MRWFSSLLLLLCGMWLGGCQQEDDFRSSAQTGFQITLTDEADQAYSRKTPAELLPAGLLDGSMISKFRLRVVDVDTKKVAYVGKCAESVLVKEGTYNLTATYGDNPVIALDAPYYVGTLENQQVVTGQMTSASITCSVANALLSVNYNKESLKKAYEDYSVTVSVGDQSVEIDATGKQSAYFQADSTVQLVFHGHLAGTGKEVSYDIPEPVNPEKPDWKPFTKIPARTHVKITLGTDTISSGVGISVEKVEVSKVSVTETLPLEFLPKPKLESADFVNNELSFAETEKKSAVINLKLSSPLQDIKLKFNSTDAKFAGLKADKEYLLSNAVDSAAVASLGITLPKIGATTGSLDFSSLIPQLMTDAGNTVASTITVDVEANNRWASEDQAANRVYTLKCNKPEFSIAVDERNCWSREFTIDEVNVTSGNPEAIKANLVYQYYDGANWIDCTTRENVKGRIQQFAQRAEDISNKVYKVRALYRGVIASAEAEATLETPMQLPNSGMEEWTDDNYKNDYYSFNPWKEKTDCHWDTSNLFTTRHRNNGTVFWVPTIAHYNGFHSVSYIPNSHSGKLAAEIRSTANGRGNTTRVDAKDYNKVAGELFTGTTNVTMGTSGGVGDADGSKDTYERIKDASFNNRPTALTFWYKYAPYTSDTWKVHIELLDEGKNVIIQKDYISSEAKEDWTEAVVDLDYVGETLYSKCKYIYVIFSSTTNAGADMPYQKITQTFYIQNGSGLSEMSFDDAYVGSVLTVDDISLVYDK